MLSICVLFCFTSKNVYFVLLTSVMAIFEALVTPKLDISVDNNKWALKLRLKWWKRPIYCIVFKGFSKRSIAWKRSWIHLIHMPGALIKFVHSLCFSLYSILTTHTLALIEKKREHLGAVFKGISLSPDVWVSESWNWTSNSYTWSNYKNDKTLICLIIHHAVTKSLRQSSLTSWQVQRPQEANPKSSVARGVVEGRRMHV